MSPLIAVVIISIAGASMVGAYLLGFRAGHTNGLELALANSVTHVVRSPIAKSSIEPSNTNTDSSDVYAKLKEPSTLHQEAQTKQADVSKEVKNFLQPTATPSQKLSGPESNLAKEADAAQKLAVASNTTIVNPLVQEKKQADTAAIQRALDEAKSEEELSLSSKTKVEDKAIRVIGGAGHEAEVETALVAGKADKVVEKEDFSEIPLAQSNKKQVNNIKQDLGVKQPTAKIGDAPTKAIEKNELRTKSSQSAKTTEAPTTKLENKKSDSQVKTAGLAPGWYSQVAAPRSLAEAQSISGKLRSAGFKARIETAEVRDEQYYRVVIGPETSRVAADQVLMKLKKQPSIKTEPFIRMVK